MRAIGYALGMGVIAACALAAGTALAEPSGPLPAELAIARGSPPTFVPWQPAGGPAGTAGDPRVRDRGEVNWAPRSSTAS